MMWKIALVLVAIAVAVQAKSCEETSKKICQDFCAKDDKSFKEFVKNEETNCRECQCEEKAACDKECPYGYKIDTYGYQTCECKCKETSKKICQDDCAKDNKSFKEFVKNEETNCRECQCEEKAACNEECPYGYKVDAYGHQTCECKCKETSKKICQDDCAKDNKSFKEFVKNEETNCRECQCEERGACNKECPNGYKVDAYGHQTCECKCKEISQKICQDDCAKDNKNFKTIMMNKETKCRECQCEERGACNKDCPNGYQSDAYGNQICQCKCKETSKKICNAFCEKDNLIFKKFVKNEETKCRECQCECKKASKKICQDFCAKDDKSFKTIMMNKETKCRECQCEERSACNKDCPNGYQSDAYGNQICQCKCKETSKKICNAFCEKDNLIFKKFVKNEETKCRECQCGCAKINKKICKKSCQEDEKKFKKIVKNKETKCKECLCV